MDLRVYIEKLLNEWSKKNSLLCFGMDPVIERMKIDTSKDICDEIFTYFSKILAVISPKISAVKPNVGFYLQYGSKGFEALIKLVIYARSMQLPVIVDAKIGDIGRTSKAYARYVFRILEGDAVTLSPYMGYDSLEPFLTYEDKGFYILVLTSNMGARDFQYGQLSLNIPFYEYVLDTLCGWNKKHESLGAVIGATQMEFKRCVEKIIGGNCSLPLLVPGVGAQGGSYVKIKNVLEELHYNLGIVRINASSSISYAYERYPSLKIEEAAYRAVEELGRT